MLLANEATYRSLSTFESVEELNEAIKIHRTNNQLSDTERAVLDLISRYACKYVGVCYLSKNNIAEAVGRVRRTVIRVCQRLEALGIIKQYETKRDGGDRRQSTNVIVILAADISPNLETSSDEQAKAKSVSYSKRGTCQHIGNSGVPSSKRSPVNGNNPVIRNSDEITSSPIGEKFEVTPDMSRHKTPITKQNNNTYKETPSTDSIIKRGLKHAIPASIFDAMAPFFDGQTLYNTYGILLRAKASIDRHITVEQHGQAYIDAFMNVVRLYKAGKVRNFNGLLYSAWQSVTATIKRRLSADKHPFIYDWLNA